MDVGKKALALLIASQLGICKAEHPHPVPIDCVQLGRSATDGIVLRQHDQPRSASVRNPLLIAGGLGACFAVDVSERVSHESGFTK